MATSSDLMAAARRYPVRIPGERLTLIVLISYMGLNSGEWTAFPGNKTLAADTLQHERTIKRHLAYFVSEGLISTRREKPTKALRTVNAIVLNVPVLLRRGSLCPQEPGDTTPLSPPELGDTPPLSAPELGDTMALSSGARGHGEPSWGTSAAITPHIEEGSEEVHGERATAVASPRGCRLPEPFPLTPAMCQWAREHVPEADLDRQTDQFRDYWRSQPGSRGVKADWVATWRTWMRRSVDFQRDRRGHENGMLAQMSRMDYDDKGMMIK